LNFPSRWDVINAYENAWSQRAVSTKGRFIEALGDARDL